MPDLVRRAQELAEYNPYGMLCRVRVYAGHTLLREVGPCVRASGTVLDPDELGVWCQDLESDREALDLFRDGKYLWSQGP